MSEGPGDGELAGEALALSEARLRRAQAVARLGSWEIDLGTRTMWGSDEAFCIYGLVPPPDRQLPLELVQAIPLPEHRGELDRALAELLSGARPYDLQFRIRRHDDGAIREVHSFAQLVRDAAGAPMLVSGTIQDVTDQATRARALLETVRAGEERVRIAFEQAADAIFLGNSAGDFVDVNARASTLTGYTRDELLRMNMRALFAAGVHRAQPLQYQRVLSGETVVNERTLSRKDGSIVPVEMRTSALSDGTLQAIIRDVSERHRLEEQLQLRQRMDSVGTLAAGIAHDFNNVLAGIMGYADILRVDAAGLSPLQRESVDAILQSCQRAADLVSGLQTLSQPESGEREAFDPFEVAAEVFLVLRETTDRIVAKEVRIPEGRFSIRGNPSALYHALMNLGVNAVQAIEQKGPASGDRVTIDAEDHTATPGDRLGLAPGPYVHLVVRDTGTGMPEEVRRRAFDPLFSTKEKGHRKGQGLGLVMVYNIVVRQHGGAIEIETAEGRGTAFHLYLPAGEAGARRLATSSPAPARGTETVLVVDDEPLISKVTRRILERSGYSVLTASDGVEALELFERRGAEIAIVVLDRTLPRLRGEEVLARMRAMRPDVRVVISSGDAGAGATQFPGASALLRKPYTPTRLCEVIREVLDAP